MRSFEISVTKMAHFGFESCSIRATDRLSTSNDCCPTGLYSSCFTEATPSDLNRDEDAAATTQHNSNYSNRALATVSYCCSVDTKLSRLHTKPFSTTSRPTTTTTAAATATTTLATLFEAYLAIIIVLTPLVTASYQAEAKDTSSTATLTSRTRTTSIVGAAATPEASPIRTSSSGTSSSSSSDSLDKALEWPVTFITQTDSLFVATASANAAPDSLAGSREVGAGRYTKVPKIELLCAKVEPKGEDLVDDDCANEDLDADEKGGSEKGEARVELGLGKGIEIGRVAKRGAKRGDENVSMRIDRGELSPPSLDPPFFHAHSSRDKIRVSRDLLWSGEGELVKSALVPPTTTNKYRVAEEKSELPKQVTKDLTSENNKKTLKEEATSKLLQPFLGRHVTLRVDRGRCEGSYCLEPKIPAPLEALLSLATRGNFRGCGGGKFHTDKRYKQKNWTKVAAIETKIIGKEEAGSRVSRETRSEQQLIQRRWQLEAKEKKEDGGLNVETSSNNFKHLPEIYSTVSNVQRRNNKKLGNLGISSRDKQISREYAKAPNIRVKRHTNLDEPLVSSYQFQVQQQQQQQTAETLLTTTSSNSIRFNPSHQADHDRMNEDLVELLAQFYAHTQELQDKLEHYLYLIKFQIQDKGELKRLFKGELGKLEKLANSTRETTQQKTNNKTETQVYISDKKKEEEITNKNSKQTKLNDSESDSIKTKQLISQQQDTRGLIEIIKMKIGADEDSLLKWLRQKQEKFSSLKNATFELLNEPPNKTINVCQDGPKILVLPNVSDIFYCYTSEQWVDKLWSDLRLSAFHYPIIVLNILIFLFGTTGNIFVCLSVYKNHQLRNVTNYFIVNLAFADFLVILICLPATVVWDLSLTWFFGTIPCKLIMFLQDVSISVSVLTLTAISIDRYYAVCYPLKFKSSLNQAKRIIVLIWIVSLILMAPDLFYLSAKYSQELSEAGLDTVLYSDCNYDWSERSSRIFQFVKTILLYLLPFILMLCAHYKIMLTLQAASQSAHNQLAATINDDCVGDIHDLEPANEESKFMGAPRSGRGNNVDDDDDDDDSGKDHYHDTGRRVEQKKGLAKAAPIKTDVHFHSLATSPPTPLLKQIRFYQTHSSNIDMFHATNSSQQSNDSRYNIKVETNSRGNSNMGCFRKFLSRLSCQNISGRPLTLAAATASASGTSSLTTYLNQARGSVGSYQMNLSPNEIVPSSRNTTANKQSSHKASTTAAAATATTNNQSSQLLVTMHNKNKLDSRKSAAKMLMTIVVMFGICYLPVHLINFLRQFIENIPQTDVTSTISMLSHCACYLNSAINPIIYNHMNSIFRAEFKKFLSCLCCWKKRGAKTSIRMATNSNNNSFKPTTNNRPGIIKLKKLNVTSQRRSPGLVHQIAISDNEEIHLNERDNNQADNGESTRITNIF